MEGACVFLVRNVKYRCPPIGVSPPSEEHVLAVHVLPKEEEALDAILDCELEEGATQKRGATAFLIVVRSEGKDYAVGTIPFSDVVPASNFFVRANGRVLIVDWFDALRPRWTPVSPAQTPAETLKATIRAAAAVVAANPQKAAEWRDAVDALKADDLERFAAVVPRDALAWFRIFEESHTLN